MSTPDFVIKQDEPYLTVRDFPEGVLDGIMMMLDTGTLIAWDRLGQQANISPEVFRGFFTTHINNKKQAEHYPNARPAEARINWEDVVS